MPMLSKDHTILEKGAMEFRPFGKNEQGEKIRDVTGIKVHAYVTHLEESLAKKEGTQAGKQASERLCSLLNDRIPDPTYHVTPTFLKNIWNSYSYEFVCYLTEFCLLISQDPQFQVQVGKTKYISPIIQTLGRPFSVPQIYKMFPHFGQKFARGSILFEVGEVTESSAILRMKYTEHVYRQFGAYRKRCADQICEVSKTALSVVPEHVHQLGHATVKDLRCIANGDEWCEWEFRWSPPIQLPFGWALGGILAGLLAFGYLQWRYPTVTVAESLAIALFPPVIAWFCTQRKEQVHSRQREALIVEQLDTVETRHEELREAFLEQEQGTVELRRKVIQLTTLHRAGLLFSATLDRETLIQNVLKTIVEELHYDRALMSFFDPVNKIVHDARVLGLSKEAAEFARAREFPVTDPTTIEGKVLLKGEPVLLENIHEQDVWERLHDLNREMAKISKATSLIVVPLKVKDKIIGSLMVDRVQGHSLTQDDLDVMSTVATQVAISLDNTDAYHQIEELNLGLERRVEERTAELQQAYEELKELDRLKSQFLAHVSHELRSPLTSIKGFAENILAGVTGAITDKQERCLERIRSNSNRLARMISDLLDRARLEAGKMEVILGEVPIALLTRECIEELTPQATEKQQTLRVDCQDDTLTVHADADKISQILINLIVNAIKYTPHDGSIRVNLSRLDAHHARLTVEDTGEGIPEKDLQSLFQPFFRVNRRHKSNVKGLGLGLSIVKQLVDLHHGSISVESELGKGTTFHVDLPLEPIVRPENPAYTEGARRILVVDDDQDILELVVDRLEGEGYQVQSARTGQDALAALQQTVYDGVILDIGLPDMDGGQILEAIRQQYPKLPVVMVTASEAKDRAMAAMKYGANAYLLKPFDSAQFKYVTTQWFSKNPDQDRTGLKS
ncbi:MAG: ATP-binding protein [Nitrospirales bacterium]|nr:ATP-binding protein [Nitrospirales bacterium]